MTDRIVVGVCRCKDLNEAMPEWQVNVVFPHRVVETTALPRRTDIGFTVFIDDTYRPFAAPTSR